MILLNIESIEREYARFLGEKYFRDGETVFINRVVLKEKTLWHAHDFIEIAYVASGYGKHVVGNQEYSVSKGNLFIINYNTPHEFIPLGNLAGDMLIYNCIFKPEFLDYSMVNCNDFSDVAGSFLFRSFFPDECMDTDYEDIKLIDYFDVKISELFEKMHDEYEKQEKGYIEIIRAYVIELLVTIFRFFEKKKMPNENLETGRRNIIGKVMEYIKDNYMHDIRLEELSMMAFLSPTYFSRLFKEHTGLTVSEYTQRIRVEEACRLLTQTDKKVIEIAGEVGYKDIKFFNKVFKRNTGKTPFEFRRGNL